MQHRLGFSLDRGRIGGRLADGGQLEIDRHAMLVGVGNARRDRLAVVDPMLRDCILAQRLQLIDDLGRLGLVAGAERFARANACAQGTQACDRAGEDRLRRPRQRGAAFLQAEQAHFQRLGGGGDQRKPAGAVNAAQRVAGAHHQLRRRRRRVELQSLQLVVQRGQMLLRLFTQNAIQRRRQRDSADSYFLFGIGKRCDGIGVGYVQRRDSGKGQCRRRRLVRSIGHIAFAVWRLVELEHFDRRMRRGRRGGVGDPLGRRNSGERPRRRPRWRWAWRWRLPPRVAAATGKLAFHLSQRCVQGAGVRSHPAGTAQCIDPAAEARLGDAYQCDQRRRRRTIFLDHAVVNLFHFVRELAQIGEPHHAAAPLQGVESATHDGQRRAIVGIRGELFRTGRDRIQHFACFGQIDVEQFGVELRRVGFQQAHRFRRRSRRRRALRRNCGNGILQGRGVGRPGMRELGQCRIGVLLQARVADQFGVVLERRQIGRQPVPRCQVAWRALIGGKGLRQRGAQIDYRRLDRLGLGGGRAGRDAKTAIEQRGDQTVAIGPLLLDGLDIEAEARQRFGQHLEVVVVNLDIRFRIFVDLLLAELEQALRASRARASSARRRSAGCRRRAWRARRACCCRGKRRRAPVPCGAGWPEFRARPGPAAISPARDAPFRRAAAHRRSAGSACSAARRRCARASRRSAAAAPAKSSRNARSSIRRAAMPSRTPSPAPRKRHPRRTCRRDWPAR